jgi:hypothetical protein
LNSEQQIKTFRNYNAQKNVKTVFVALIQSTKSPRSGADWNAGIPPRYTTKVRRFAAKKKISA